METPRGYVEVTEAATRLGCSAATVRRYLVAGRLAGVKVGTTWLVAERSLARLARPNLGRPPKPKGNR